MSESSSLITIRNARANSSSTTTTSTTVTGMPEILLHQNTIGALPVVPALPDKEQPVKASCQADSTIGLPAVRTMPTTLQVAEHSKRVPIPVFVSGNATHAAGALGHKPDANASLRKHLKGEISFNEYYAAFQRRARHLLHHEAAIQGNCIYCKHRVLIRRFPQMHDVAPPAPGGSYAPIIFVRDATILPGGALYMQPGQKFEQCFKLRNISHSPLDQSKSIRLVQIEGPDLGCGESILAHSVPSRAFFDAKVNLISPCHPGKYLTLWRVFYGDLCAPFVLWCAVIVGHEIPVSDIAHVAELHINDLKAGFAHATSGFTDAAYQMKSQMCQVVTNSSARQRLGRHTRQSLKFNLLPPITTRSKRKSRRSLKNRL